MANNRWSTCPGNGNTACSMSAPVSSSRHHTKYKWLLVISRLSVVRLYAFIYHLKAYVYLPAELPMNMCLQLGLGFGLTSRKAFCLVHNQTDFYHRKTIQFISSPSTVETGREHHARFRSARLMYIIFVCSRDTFCREWSCVYYIASNFSYPT